MEDSQYALLSELEGRYWWHRSLRELVLGHLGTASLVLDAGCGTGGMLGEIRGLKPVGLDFSQTALRYAAKRPGPPLVQGSICRLPFREAHFDAVVALDVLYHRLVENEEGALRECARVLKPGGIVILHLPALPWMRGGHDLSVHGVRRYTLAGVERLVSSSGLEVVKLSYRNLLPLPFAVVTRKLFPRFFRPDFRELSPCLNRALLFASRAENLWLRRFGLPVGLSLFCVARKPNH